MTEIPIIISNDSVTVGGYVDQVELELESGLQGPRGTRVFSGPTNPNSLPLNSPYFGGYDSFIQGDLFYMTASTDAGDIWEYSAGSGVWVKILTKGGLNWYTGTGDPNNVVTALQGSLYTRSDGSTNTTLYVKTSGSGSTGWTAK